MLEFDIFEKLQKHLKIQYIYQEEENGLKRDVCSEKMSDSSLVSSIKGLSRDVIDRLQESTELSDALIIDRIIEEIRCTNDQLADELNELEKRFAYDRILYLIQKALKRDGSR